MSINRDIEFEAARILIDTYLDDWWWQWGGHNPPLYGNSEGHGCPRGIWLDYLHIRAINENEEFDRERGTK